MVNTLAAMHNLKGKHIDFTQAFPQAKIKEDIYLRFSAGFEHKHEKWALKLKRNLYGLIQASRNCFFQTQRSLRETRIQTLQIRSISIPQKRHDHRSIYGRLSTIRPRHKSNRLFRESTAR
jgi:hypothetical protein